MYLSTAIDPQLNTQEVVKLRRRFDEMNQLELYQTVAMIQSMNRIMIPVFYSSQAVVNGLVDPRDWEKWCEKVHAHYMESDDRQADIRKIIGTKKIQAAIKDWEKYKQDNEKNEVADP